jgi:hypothetical protein
LKRTVLALFFLTIAAQVPSLALPGSAMADVTCTATADPGTPAGLQAVLDSVAASGDPNPVACIPSGSYTATTALTIGAPMTVLGLGATRPVIACGNTYCFDASNGPSSVTFQHLQLNGGHVGGLKIGKSGGPPTTDWTLNDMKVTAAGQVGITIANAANIEITGSTLDGNGTIPYGQNGNQSDFGLRANQVNGLTIQNSVVSNNPATSTINTGFAAGLKINSSENVTVQNNQVTGNAGGAQIWLDISSSDFHVLNNTLGGGPGATSHEVANAGIRAEVSCAGLNGSEITGNVLVGGSVAGIDVFDSSGVAVTNNAVTVPQDAGTVYGIRMLGNVHGSVGDNACQQAGTFPNRDNVASGNTIDMTQAPKGLNGVINNNGGVTANNAWSDNDYTQRHCDGPAPYAWKWWDGSASLTVGYTTWRSFGQDPAPDSTCTATLPEFDAGTPFSPPWGPVGTAVTLNGRGLSGITSVKFNGTAASFTKTDTSIGTTVPNGATTGTVCVTGGANSACSPTSFLVGPTQHLSVTTGGTGTGSVTSQAPYGTITCGSACQSEMPQGANVVLHAQAVPNSSFAGWSGDCTGTGDCTVSMTAARSVTATFDRVSSDVDVSVLGSGNGSVTSDPIGVSCPGTCAKPFDHGSPVELTAQADPDSRFVGWGGDCAGTDPSDPCALTADADKSATATFTLTHTLDVAIDGGGTGSGTVTSDVGGIDCPSTCSSGLDDGDTVVLTAHPDNGSALGEWDYGTCGSALTCQVTMDASHTVMATFESSFDLTVNVSGDGNVTSANGRISCPSACSAAFGMNRDVTLHATPDANAVFAGWSGDCTDAGDCTVTMDQPHSVTATFEPAWTLTVQRTGAGAGHVTSDDESISCAPNCVATYPDGTPVTLHAEDGPNATFASWSGDVDGSCPGIADCVVSMTVARTVVANYTPITRQLSITKTGGTGGGTVTSLAPNSGIDCGATCATSFQQGTAVVLHAAPDAASTFTGWSGGGCSGTTDCTVTLGADTTVNARFDPALRSLTVTKGGTGTGSITSNTGGINCPGTCSASYAHGTVVQLTATPSGGSTFAGWSGGSCSGTLTTCSLTMDQARGATATFDPPGAPVTVKDGDGAVTYNGWVGVADAGASGGSYRTSDVQADTVTWRSPITASITLTVHEGPGGGKASVTIDGTNKGTLDLYSSTPMQFSKSYGGLAKKAHTIVVKVLHTKSAASSGYAVGFDAFVVGTTTTQDSAREIEYDAWDGRSDAGATNGTYHLSANAKAVVTLSFNGIGVDWVTAKGKAYGKAKVLIDGVSRGSFDLYQKTTAWQSVEAFGGFTRGPHTITIQVLGTKNAAATGKDVVVDGFVIHP